MSRKEFYPIVAKVKFTLKSLCHKTQILSMEPPCDSLVIAQGQVGELRHTVSQGNEYKQ
jgi:hypothetical protein